MQASPWPRLTRRIVGQSVTGREPLNTPTQLIEVKLVLQSVHEVVRSSQEQNIEKVGHVPHSVVVRTECPRGHHAQGGAMQRIRVQAHFDMSNGVESYVCTDHEDPVVDFRNSHWRAPHSFCQITRGDRDTFPKERRAM